MIFSPILEFKEEYHSEDEQNRNQASGKESLSESPRKTEITQKPNVITAEQGDAIDKIINYSQDSIKHEMEYIEENEKTKSPFLDQISKKLLDFSNIHKILDDELYHLHNHHHLTDGIIQRETGILCESERSKDNMDLEKEMKDFHIENDPYLNFLL